MYESGLRAVCFSQLHCNHITHFPSIMPPVRRIYFEPVRSLSFESRSRSSAICVVCVKRLFSRTFRLQIVHRDLGYSPEQVRFKDLLRHTFKGALNRQEWEFLDSRYERKLTPMFFSPKDLIHELVLFRPCECDYWHL